MDQVDTFYDALSATSRPDPAADRIAAQGTLQEILAWLWEVAAEPVLQVLGYYQPPPDGTVWPRVWWVPDGLLGLLPLHAAGYHSIPPDPRHRAVLDRVVSSYTPTVGALKQAREHAKASASVSGRSLIVAMPTTPGLPSLPSVAREAAMLQARLPSPVLLTEPDPAGEAQADPDELPTRDNVLARLPGAAIAHFACHGFSNAADPSRSLLLLHDHRDSPLNVAALAAVSLDHAQLAYLSACTTARPDGAGLLDEAIHLSSALQLAGFPQVIGTLWEIDDEFAVTICDTFYTNLTTSAGAIDTSHSARALHQAIRELRHQQPAFPAVWAAYIHAGA
jgi:CHAT domain-containing protein